MHFMDHGPRYHILVHWQLTIASACISAGRGEDGFLASCDISPCAFALKIASACLQDEERMKKATNVVPSHQQLNALLARTPDEEALFNKLDAELQWPQIPVGEPSHSGAMARSRAPSTLS